jgi:hypothetical protein
MKSTQLFSPLAIIFLFILTGFFISANLFNSDHDSVQDQTSAWKPQTAITPTVDRLALPVLSEHPSQVELGSYLYYHHCMPCHGDRGQGLTDEWREVWVEDHQNCWAKGCHSFRDQDEVFTIPTTIPPVSGTIHFIQRFPEPANLFEYLSLTHPPQSPGILSVEQYWAITAFLLVENEKLDVKGEVGPLAEKHARQLYLGVGSGVIFGISLVILLIVVMKKRSRAIQTIP